MVLSMATSAFAAPNADVQKIDNRSDMEIVNDNLKAKGFKELKSSDINFLEKDGQWEKIVKYFRNSDSKTQLDYKVIPFENGSLAIVPKGCNVTVSSDESKKDTIIEPSTSSNSLTSATSSLASGGTYYLRDSFNKTFSIEAWVRDIQVTTTGLKIWYYYKSDTVHSINFDGNYYYCYSTSPSTHTYNTVQFTNIVNGYYDIQLRKDSSSTSANLYGEIGDGPI